MPSARVIMRPMASERGCGRKECQTSAGTCATLCSLLVHDLNAIDSGHVLDAGDVVICPYVHPERVDVVAFLSTHDATEPLVL